MVHLQKVEDVGSQVMAGNGRETVASRTSQTAARQTVAISGPFTGLPAKRFRPAVDGGFRSGDRALEPRSRGFSALRLSVAGLAEAELRERP